MRTGNFTRIFDISYIILGRVTNPSKYTSYITKTFNSTRIFCAINRNIGCTPSYTTNTFITSNKALIYSIFYH